MDLKSVMSWCMFELRFTCAVFVQRKLRLTYKVESTHSTYEIHTLYMAISILSQLNFSSHEQSFTAYWSVVPQSHFFHTKYIVLFYDCLFEKLCSYELRRENTTEKNEGKSRFWWFFRLTYLVQSIPLQQANTTTNNPTANISPDLYVIVMKYANTHRTN